MVFHLDQVREMFWDYGSDKQRVATEEEKQLIITGLRAELNRDEGRFHYEHQVR